LHPKILNHEFFLQDTNLVAKKLIGKKLVKITRNNSRKITLSGIIVETEAYGYKRDEASHAYRGMTKRNIGMFGPVGRSYIYFTYGNHYCFNVTAKSNNQIAGAVLIRGVEPKEGIQYMKDNRNLNDIRGLTNGPGKITQAFCIDKQYSNLDLTNRNNDLYIVEGFNPDLVLATKRIGIKKSIHVYKRYILASKIENKIFINKFVSEKKENNLFHISRLS
jgi:DNA-3-methyladenine glycosylase